jgi:hypothetical protein
VSSSAAKPSAAGAEVPPPASQDMVDWLSPARFC